jgi:predicted nucleic acid-binding protein
LAERPAVNASPLIYLAGTDFLSLLQIAGLEIVVPGPVAEEIRAGGTADAAVRALESTPWLTVVEGPAVPAAIQAWDLGDGQIPATRPVLEVLRGSGMYLSDPVLNKALALVGE